MIITRTPLRISFAGGGSDLKEYYLNHGGSVLSVAINKYIYLSMHPYFQENKYFLKYSKNELVDSIDNIQHRIIKQVFQDFNISGVDFNSSADIPSGTGLGSSSSFTSGLTTLCSTYNNNYMSLEDIAKYACEVEINKLKEPIGKQDQYACAIGGLNFIKFNKDDTVSVEKIILKPEKVKQLENNLFLFYLGNTRSASKILTEQKKNTINDQRKVESLHKMVALSEDLKKEFVNNNIDAIGEILHKGWMYKKELADQISNNRIDYYYQLGIENGASGGKLLGAGGGGFLLFYVKEDNHEKVKQALNDLEEIEFKFNFEGTKVIHYNK
ncbi:GHMP kinase [Winogradskyella sp. PG-2]|uniref:GHMP family kinase ATP-binding protein n=1 Tax=Winogradskyella sp. PG-2 TaxID=754409 RepID=UPI0004586D15|nr:GHMP kinase [Winogradskyella sp. PG-2]BAO75044.1 D,D-heptose 7-phosphate kinase [Winogradskyella sp. PG-2]